MSTHKHIDRICAVVTALALVISVLLMNAESLGISVKASAMGYETRLFDTSRVHTFDIVMDDWDSFIDTAQSEEYSMCAVVIDGEAYRNVAIRGKGNTSLSNVASMDSNRYSFKVEFDHYDETKTYYGLDKLCLNNIIQDNTYMKDYLVYRMMNEFGVNAPLCSFVYITVNGEDWGLYLAVEGIEEGFLERNYGGSYGELYKPDSMSFGGGRGNGKDFSFDDIKDNFAEFSENNGFDIDGIDEIISEFAENNGLDFNSIEEKISEFTENGDFNFEDVKKLADESGFTMPDMSSFDNKGGFGGGMGSSDVKLQYIDDNADSYSNIFDNAKTDVTDEDKERLISSLKQLSEYTDVEQVVNIEEVIRYFVVHNYVCNGDSYTGSMIHNYYLYEKDGQLSMIPWDYNLAFGTFQGGNAQSQVNAAIDLDLTDRPMVNWIFENEEYTELYHQYFSEFLDSVDVLTIIDEAYSIISPYVEKDPTKFCTYEEYEKGVETLRAFCELRSQSVSGQLDGSIPSTSDGQNSDSSALVGASSVTLSDMGTMSNGGGKGGNEIGGFGGDKSGKRNRSQDSSKQTDLIQTSVEASADSDGFAQQPEMAQGEMPNGGMQMDDMQAPEMPSDGQMLEMPSDGQMPEMSSDGQMHEMSSDGQMPEMPSNGQMPDAEQSEITQETDDETAKSEAEAPTETGAAETEPQTATDETSAEKTAPSDLPQNTANQNGVQNDKWRETDEERGFGGENRDDDNTETVVLLGATAVVLIAGLVFAFKFKR